MDRRPLPLLLVAGLLVAAPSGAASATPAELFAAAPTGTLREAPADTSLRAQAPSGTLTDAPAKAPATPAPKSKPAAATPAPAATALPFTGSDPRITLLLGVAALLVGAGLRLRTGDARDF